VCKWFRHTVEGNSSSGTHSDCLGVGGAALDNICDVLDDDRLLEGWWSFITAARESEELDGWLLELTIAVVSGWGEKALR
jgi:hypothetical protein